MYKTICFIESIEEVKSLNDVCKDDLIVICTNPVVFNALSAEGFQCRNTMNFFGKQGHEHVLRSTAKIVEIIRPVLSNFEGSFVKDAFERTSIFYIRFFLNYIISQLYIMDSAVNDIRPKNILLLPTANIENLSAILLQENGFLQNVAQIYAISANISIVNTSKAHAGKAVRDNKIKKQLISFLFMLLVRLYPLYVKNKKVILAPADTYNMSSLLNHVNRDIESSVGVFLTIDRDKIRDSLPQFVKNKMFAFFSLPSLLTRKQKKVFNGNWSVVRNTIDKAVNESGDEFKFNNADISGIFKVFLSKAIYKQLVELEANSIALQKIIKIKKPHAVIAQHSLGISYALGEMCKKQDIPGLLVSHGSHVSHKGELAEIEWSEHARTLFDTHYPFVAVQTRLAELYASNIKNLRSVPIKTGPLVFGKIYDNKKDRIQKKNILYGKHSGKKILLHASSPKPWAAFRPWVYETIDEYVENINRLIKATEQVSGIHLAIRFRPFNGLTLVQVKKLLVDSECYGIYSDGSFEEHLLSADMLVSYSSTTLEEALQNRIPILQFDPDAKYWHIPCGNHQESITMQKSAVQCASSHQELIRQLNELVAGDFSHIPESEWRQHILKKNLRWLDEMLGD